MEKTSDNTDLNKKIEDFIRKNKIEDIMADLVNNVLVNMDSKPIITMIKHLASYSTADELKENGIEIKDPISNPKLAITFPQFSIMNNSLFKKHLTAEIFKEIKDLNTQRNISFREILNTSLQNQDNSVGVFAIDHDVYFKFAPIFDPILKELNANIELSKNISKVKGELDKLQLKPSYKSFLYKLKIKVMRNFKDYPFNPCMSINERDDLNKRVGVALNRASLPIKAISSLSSIILPI